MRFRARSLLSAGAEQVYNWHVAPGALANLVPPWERVRLPGFDQGISPGCVRELRVSPVGLRWLARHHDFVEGLQFRDTQQSGPFRAWSHLHRFESQGSQCWLVDEVDFELPFSPFSRLILPWLEPSMRRMFWYRHRITDSYLGLAIGARPLRIAVTGSTGMIGRRLVPFLTAAGHTVLRLVRRKPLAPDELAWDPLSPAGLESLDGFDAVVHLAGKGVLEGNWNSKHRQEIRESRVITTAHLVRGLLSLANPPGVFIGASGIGYYGSASESVHDEDSSAGPGFLAEVCQDWEAASQALEPAGIRRVLLRIAPVLHLSGGALPPLSYSCLAGVNFRIGQGEQPWSWVSMEDVLGMIGQALYQPHWVGPINVVAPGFTTMGHFAAQVGGLMGSPRQLSIPENLVRRMLGSRAEVVMGGCLAYPARALQWGYTFQYPDLEDCLRQALGRYTSQDQPRCWSWEWGVQGEAR